MKPATPDPDHSDDDWIRLALHEAGAPDVVPRPEYVADLRATLLDRLGPPRPVRRRTARLVLASGVATLVIVLACVALTLNRPAIAWSQIAQALQGRPWVHASTVGPDGKVIVEHWLSADRQRSAARAGPMIRFQDVGRKVFTHYVPADDVIYRLPTPEGQAADGLDFLPTLLDTLRDLPGPPRFPFPGMELIGQSQRPVEEAGRPWLDIEWTLRVAGGSRGGPLPMRIRVDPATRLPASVSLVTEDGQRYAITIDYPERGPADIHDLGVPRTARVIERTPTDGVDQVLAKLKATRRTFDDYKSYVVEERIKPTYYLPRVTAYRVWRRGTRWRIDQVRPDQTDWAPPPDADLRWWREREGHMTFVPRIIADGRHYWDYYLADAWKPGTPAPKPGAATPLGQTVGPNQLMGPADDPTLPFWCQDLLAEQAGHPTAGVGQPDPGREFLIEAKPTSGPPSTILLRGRDTNPRTANLPDYFRLWLDPGADHLTMRAEIRVQQAADPAKVAFIDTHTVEIVGQSPLGHAYPARTRQVAYNGEHEIVRRFVVDFEAAIPENLFQPLP